MSLLMDALRKAEQEKKAAAEKLREKQESVGQGESGSEGLSLSLTDDYEKKPTHTEDEDDTPNPSVTPDAPEDPDATLAESSADLLPGLVNDEPSNSDTELPETVASDTGGNREDTGQHCLEESRENTASGHGEKYTIDMSGEATEQTLGNGSKQHEEDTLIIESRTAGNNEAAGNISGLSATQEHTRTYSDKTSRGTREYSQVDKSGYTPVSAQNVFAARKSTSYATLTISILVLLVVVGLSAYGVFYYFSVTPINRDMPSPAVARGVEATESLPVAPEDAQADAGVTIKEIEPPQVPPPEAAEIAQTTDELLYNMADLAAGEKAAEQAVAGGGAEMARPDEERAQPVKPSEGDNGEATASVTAQAPTEEIELKPELVQISRSRQTEQKSQPLMDAYQSFRNGDLDTARALYGAVLDKEPDNQDALLGLAAIAVREERHAQAYVYYSGVLRLNPANPNARAALINLQQQVDPAVSENRIRQLLEQYPDSAYLNYVLGNVYSRQKRWPEAQQAYFNAFAGDSENPDYALNLAVSLDHMSQYETALDYYKEALSLADDKPAGFNASVVHQRISELSK